MNHLWQDVRYGVRQLLKRPGFSAAAILVLALGIGVNSAVFSLINAFLLKPVLIEKAEELTGLFSRDSKHPDNYRGFSYPNYVDIRDNNPVFSNLLAHTMAMIGIQEGDTTRRAFAGVVSSNYFATLGVRLKGRAFTPAEEKPGSPLVVVATTPYWKKTGQDPALLGKQVRINGRNFTIVGITPEGFTGTTAMVGPELFLPLGAFNLVMNDFDGRGKVLADRNNDTLILVGRFKPGVTQQIADTKLAVIASQMEKAFPAENKDQTLIVRPLSRMGISTNPSSDTGLRMPALLLLSLATVVLLIASLNLANMMMTRGSARRKEIAIRLAIGGGRRRIVQQLVTEGMMLAILGGAAGLFAASWGTTLLIGSLSRMAPMEVIFDVTPDARVIGATLLFCTFSTVIFGLFPAWKLSKPDVWLDLKENSGEDVSGGARRLFSRRNILVMAQLSLSLMMLSAAGLFVRSAMRAANIQPGFTFDNEILAEVDPSLINYDEVHGRQVYRALEERLRQIPGVQSVALAATVPFGMVRLGKGITPADSMASADHPALSTRFNVVSEDYFQTLNIPLLQGRSFSSGETMAATKTRVAIIDQVAATKLWPGGNALGRHIRLTEGAAPGAAGITVDSSDSEPPRELEVVGIVGGTRDDIIMGGANQAHLYVPFGQEYRANMQIHVKFAGGGTDAETRMLDSVRREIRSVDERLPLLALKTLRGHLESGMDIWVVRTGAQVLEIFGAIAIFLAVIGLYGVNAQAVARRTREIGIRMALGADAGATLKMILREGLRVTAVGLGAGFLLAVALGQLLRGILYGVGRIDPAVLIGASAILGFVALMACYFPARKASQVDPMIALRYE